MTDPSAGRTFSTTTEAEVFSQPDMWARAIAESSSTDKVLPPPGTPVLFVGCGTSYYMGAAYAAARNAADLGRTRAAVASEVGYVDAEETVVVLSRSGTTGDVIDFVERIRADHHVVGVIGEVDAPLVGLCDEVVQLDYADEQSVVQTRFATTALTVLRASLGQDLTGLTHAAEAALARPVPLPLPAHVVFLGAGWTLGVAHEAALKCLESAGVWVEAYAAREYQHGPISAAGADTLVWSFTDLPSEVSDPILATGARVVQLDLDPQAALVAAHRLALALAARAGRNPDRPVHLARSVQGD